MRPANLGTTRLKRRRRRTDPMQAYDSLSPVLRRWLAGAVLPWSAASVQRAFDRAVRRTGTIEGALAELDRIEARLVARDAVEVWGGRVPPAPPGRRLQRRGEQGVTGRRVGTAQQV